MNKSTKDILATASLKVIVAGAASAAGYTIEYDANGGKNASAMQTKTAQKTITFDRDYSTREGYAFVGWATTNEMMMLSSVSSKSLMSCVFAPERTMDSGSPFSSVKILRFVPIFSTVGWMISHRLPG